MQANFRPVWMKSEVYMYNMHPHFHCFAIERNAHCMVVTFPPLCDISRSLIVASPRSRPSRLSDHDALGRYDSFPCCRRGCLLAVADGVKGESLFYSVPQCERRNARIASAVLATAIPSVCLTRAGIVSKRRHVAWCCLHGQIAKCV